LAFVCSRKWDKGNRTQSRGLTLNFASVPVKSNVSNHGADFQLIAYFLSLFIQSDT
jgi:hypothetical protein